ncbi:hypothetical protein PV326_009202 [Microctonus aethiopoides]|nr:hypothetical protein PV326_009202 [Microctonus aethiopoides]
MAIVAIGATNAHHHVDPSKCLINEVKCRDGSHCIPKHFICDGSKDCHDHSDEQNCLNYTCPDHKIKCADGTCIHKMLLCDEIQDCPGGGDEHKSICSKPKNKLGKLKIK